MTHIHSLGAINKNTGEYVYPKIANKKDHYICPDCNKDLILCQGEVRIHHFRHNNDTKNPCHYYNKPTETQIHKDAKMLMKTLLDKKIPLSFIRNCEKCKKNEEFEIPEVTNTSSIHLEYRFEYNGLKIADVAYIDNEEILCIFEICNTHKTSSENRPEPWFEIDALTLMKLANENSLSSLQIPCIRCEKCEECEDFENKNMKDINIEKYIRIKLGQKIFPKIKPDNCKKCDKNNMCDECIHSFSMWLSKSYTDHLRFDFDAQSDVKENKKIIDLFTNDFYDKRVAVQSYKGIIVIYIVSKISYDKYNYWDSELDFNAINGNPKLPYIKFINGYGQGTVDIIKQIIEYCQSESLIKATKIKEINSEFESFEKKEVYKCDGDDDAETMRYMRFQKQDTNYKYSLKNQLLFIENDILYTLGNNVVTIEHPVTKTKIRRSIVTNKTFYKGKWIDRLQFNLLLNWYNSINNDIIDSLF